MCFNGILIMLHYSYSRNCQDFPDGAVVKNLPANAGDTGSSPVPGKMEQLSLCTTTT